MSKEIKKKNVETAIDGVEVNEAFDEFVPNLVPVQNIRYIKT